MCVCVRVRKSEYACDGGARTSRNYKSTKSEMVKRKGSVKTMMISMFVIMNTGFRLKSVCQCFGCCCCCCWCFVLRLCFMLKAELWPFALSKQLPNTTLLIYESHFFYSGDHSFSLESNTLCVFVGVCVYVHRSNSDVKHAIYVSRGNIVNTVSANISNILPC